MSKARVTLYLDGDRWRTFRAACVTRGRSASRVVEALVAEQLRAWAGDAVQETSSPASQEAGDDDIDPDGHGTRADYGGCTDAMRADSRGCDIGTSSATTDLRG